MRQEFAAREKMKSGRVRKELTPGYNRIIDGELKELTLGVILLSAGDTVGHELSELEHAIVLIYGCCSLTGPDGKSYAFGPRADPCTDKPYILFNPGGGEMTLTASEDSLVAVCASSVSSEAPVQYLPPDEIREGERGQDNWTRWVRLAAWSDNTEGNRLMIGETITPSGNWSTIPPHRHEQYEEGSEAPYEEAYFYRFSRPQGYGLVWQFDATTGMDQAFSVRNNDTIYIGGGYHPVVCGPGATLYHLTVMAGPYRQSMASLHPDFRFLVEEKGISNPFQNQEGKIGK
jgi:5-deoxy-glucuronate isomerase